MRKLLLLFLLLFLVACGASEATESSGEADEGSESKAAPEAKPKSQTAAVSADPIAPGETAAEAGIIRDRDWSKGAEDPMITIIEYGDFQ